MPQQESNLFDRRPEVSGRRKVFEVAPLRRLDATSKLRSVVDEATLKKRRQMRQRVDNLKMMKIC